MRHPLLLTLALIVRVHSGSLRVGNVASLIEAAVDTLSYLWDMGKGITRETLTPINGKTRENCLKRLAFTFDDEPVSQHRAIGVVEKQLSMTRWENVEAAQVLTEMARFYGIFVPSHDLMWRFVHKSIQDFLAAKYWVETGRFATDVASGGFPPSSRTAFAACLIPNATALMESLLTKKEGLTFFVEALTNDATFDHLRVARAIVKFYEGNNQFYYRRGSSKLECHINSEFVTRASTKFLDCLIYVCAKKPGRVTDTLAAYGLVELSARGCAVSDAAYRVCMKNYVGDDFTFYVSGRPTLRMRDVHVKGANAGSHADDSIA